MLTESEKILICRYIDRKLDLLRKINNADLDYRTAINYQDELYNENNAKNIAEISEIFGFAIDKIREFYFNPEVNFKTNIPCTESSIGSCFFVARSKSIVKTVDTKPEFVHLSDEQKAQLDFDEIKTIVKITRTILSQSQYIITEKIVNVPKELCNKAYQSLYSINLEKIAKEKSFEIKPEDAYSLALINTQLDYWMTFAKNSNNTLVNNSLFSSWEEYAKLFQKRYNSQIDIEDFKGHSYWVDEENIIFDNRRASNGKQLTLESQYRAR